MSQNAQGRSGLGVGSSLVAFTGGLENTSHAVPLSVLLFPSGLVHLGHGRALG